MVVALITSAALDILFTAVLTTDMLSPESLSVDWVNAVLFVVALLLLRRLKANPIAVMAGCDGVYVLVAALSGGIV